MALVAGLGSGFVSLVVIWVIGIFICILLARASGSISTGIFGVGIVLVIVTVAMILYPRKTLQEEVTDSFSSELKDNLSLPRIVLFSLICVFLVIGLLLFFIDAMDPIYTPAVSARRQYSF